MKRGILFAALLATLSPLAIHTAHASGATINLAPGVTLQLGDRDRRGYYWDGGHWREPRWWNDRYRYQNHRWWRHEEWRRHEAWERERDRRRHERWRDEHRYDHHDRGRGRGRGHDHDHGHDRW